MTPAEDDDADEEAEALALWDGDGAVRLLATDRTRRALLIERAVPGTDISGLPEDEATAVAVRVGPKLCARLRRRGLPGWSTQREALSR